VNNGGFSWRKICLQPSSEWDRAFLHHFNVLHSIEIIPTTLAVTEMYLTFHLTVITESYALRALTVRVNREEI
jgi:hypothetical protein